MLFYARFGVNHASKKMKATTKPRGVVIIQLNRYKDRLYRWYYLTARYSFEFVPDSQVRFVRIP